MKRASGAAWRVWGGWAITAAAVGGCTTLLGVDGSYEPLATGQGGTGGMAAASTAASGGGATASTPGASASSSGGATATDTTSASASSSSTGGTTTSSAGSGGAGGGPATSSTGTSASSGGGGVIGTGVLGRLGDPCTNVGQLGCAGNAQKSKLICGAGHTWETNSTCDGDTLCDATVNVGTCEPPAAGCAGKRGGDTACVGLQRVKCGPDLVTSEEIETCPYLCTPAQCTGECMPLTDKRCSGNLPQTCDANGAWQDGTTCSAQTPVCTAGVCGAPPSCASLASTCGPASAASESCCASPIVTGGTYNRSNDSTAPATVSNFRLDRFEITVGRFRAFVNAYDASPGSKPTAGAGKNPPADPSGWNSTWSIAANAAALKTAVKCGSAQTWTDAAGSNENKPMTCLDWYEAYAFCAWDAGRLPTEAEWNYAAAAGSKERQYPWSNPASSTTIDGTYAIYNNAALTAVGSRSPKGDGYWTHADLAGGADEWTLDWAGAYSTPCVDCSNASPSASGRELRGGGWNYVAANLLSSFRGSHDPTVHDFAVGARCARIP